MTIGKVTIDDAFAGFTEQWSPRLAGEVNGTHIRLVRIGGMFHWHHHEVEDECFLVVAGLLRMHLRDDGGERSIDLGPGELIVIPHGTEHRPEAPDGECRLVLIEPATTLNTGNVENERTVREVPRI